MSLLLLLVAPVCAEYLAAYDDSTGRPLVLLGSLLIFVPLYGAPALLIRELARRCGAGWPGVLWLSTAAGLLQAGVIDQSLFSVSYRGLDTWDAWRTATLIPWLGISAHMLIAFVGGHVAFSFAAPIAPVEALSNRPTAPWLRVRGLVVVTILYVAAAALVLAAHLKTETSHASSAQGAGALGAAAAVTAWGLRRARPIALDEGRRAPRAWLPGTVAFFVAASVTLASESWGGVLLSAVAIVALGAWIVRSSRAADWSRRHGVAVATGALVSRAVLAFTYMPLFGTVEPWRKYAHNAVLLALIAGLAALAWRRARPAPAE